MGGGEITLRGGKQPQRVDFSGSAVSLRVCLGETVSSSSILFNITPVKVCKINSGIARRYLYFQKPFQASKPIFGSSEYRSLTLVLQDCPEFELFRILVDPPVIIYIQLMIYTFAELLRVQHSIHVTETKPVLPVRMRLLCCLISPCRWQVCRPPYSLSAHCRGRAIQYNTI